MEPTTKKYTLKLSFGTDLGGLTTISVTNARSDIEDASVSAAMDRIIACGVVDTDGGILTSRDSAQMHITTTEDIAM
jgi:hypothetical protein